MIKTITTNIKELRKPCELVNKDDKEIKSIIQDLKDTLNSFSAKAIGLSANQIGINKRISYIKIPRFMNQNKEMQYDEYILINAKIIEKDRPIQVKNESCLSFPGVGVITRRYVFVTVEYLDENFKSQINAFQDLPAICVQHEIDHLDGRLILDRSGWKRKLEIMWTIRRLKKEKLW